MGAALMMLMTTNNKHQARSSNNNGEKLVQLNNALKMKPKKTESLQKRQRNKSEKISNGFSKKDDLNELLVYPSLVPQDVLE